MERVLGLTFSLFRFGWLRLVGLSLLIGLPVYLVVALVQVPVGEDLALVQQAQLDLAAGRQVTLDQVVPMRALAVSLLAALLAGMAGYLAQASVIALMAAAYAGRPVSAGAALRATIRRAPTLIAGALVVFAAIFAVVIVGVVAASLLIALSMSGGRVQPGLGVFGGLIVIVGALAVIVFLTVRWSFLAQLVMLERLSGPAALRRSWRLAAGSSWRVLGYTVVFAIMIGGVGLLVDTFTTAFLGTGLRLVAGQLVFEPGPYLAGALVSAAVSLALAPISIIGLTLVYFDLRQRHGETPLPSVPE
jgi:hypothetical protein